jgi:site-specific recombinase XerD
MLKIHGKGKKERNLPLPITCVESINTYLKVRIIPKTDKDALFTSSMLRRISISSVQKMIREYITKAGLDKKISCHKLRHSFASINYEYGNHDLKALQEALGHESLKTTEIYTHLSKDKLKKMLDSNPLNKHSKSDTNDGKKNKTPIK